MAGTFDTLRRSAQRLRNAAAIAALAGVCSVKASPPPDIPGEDITTAVSKAAVPSDSLRDHPPESSPSSLSWFDQAVKTWDAPPLSQQMTESQSAVPLGMASIFVPTLTKGTLEPDVEILDSTGKIAGSGKTGRSYAVLPGMYYVLMGSGSHKQRIVRPVSAVEARTTPVVPTWAGLAIDVVDENNLLFRGQYELARIDEFEAFGRGYGRDPNLGEDLKTWILKPGVYKIFSPGVGYNSLINFITVRLLPGELTRVVVVQTAADMHIISGGTIDFSPSSTGAKHWTERLDVGGSILFTANKDRLADTLGYNTTASLLLNAVALYRRGALDWTSSLRLDEALTLQGLHFNTLSNSRNQLRLNSLYVWRFLSWLGPYGRFFLETGVLPDYAHVDEKTSHHFILYTDQNNAITSVDSSSSSGRIVPAFSPLQLEAGVGANADVFSFRFLQTRFRAGFGMKRVSAWGQYTERDTVYIPAGDSAALRLIDSNYTHLILQSIPNPALLEYGPEAALSLFLRLGQFATEEAEIRLFLPLDRIEAPDIDLTSTLSWRLTRSITVDYEYEYHFSLPPDNKANQVNRSSHTVRVRFSFTKR